MQVIMPCCKKGEQILKMRIEKWENIDCTQNFLPSLLRCIPQRTENHKRKIFHFKVNISDTQATSI